MVNIESEIKDNIAIIQLNNGVTNPINTKLCKEFINTLNEVVQIADLHGLIITSASSKFFSIGFDLPNLLKEDRDGIFEFYNAFNDLCETLFTFPVYTLSAITGHYVAGGSLITACTDSRIAVDGRAKTGITAIKLGLSVPLLGQLIVRSRMKSSYADEFLKTGDFYEIPWAYESGYIDELSSQEELLNDALEMLASNQIILSPDFKAQKEQKTKLIIDEFRNKLESDRDKFVDSWFDLKVQSALKEATKKF